MKTDMEAPLCVPIERLCWETVILREREHLVAADPVHVGSLDPHAAGGAAEWIVPMGVEAPLVHEPEQVAELRMEHPGEDGHLMGPGALTTGQEHRRRALDPSSVVGIHARRGTRVAVPDGVSHVVMIAALSGSLDEMDAALGKQVHRLLGVSVGPGHLGTGTPDESVLAGERRQAWRDGGDNSVLTGCPGERGSCRAFPRRAITQVVAAASIGQKPEGQERILCILADHGVGTGQGHPAVAPTGPDAVVDYQSPCEEGMVLLHLEIEHTLTTNGPPLHPPDSAGVTVLGCIRVRSKLADACLAARRRQRWEHFSSLWTTQEHIVGNPTPPSALSHGRTCTHPTRESQGSHVPSQAR